MKRDLTSFEAGDSVTITEISAGHHAAVQLSQLGINTGDRIEIVRTSTLRGPIIINIRNTELAIGHGIARKIIGVKV
ncbi:MAG: ferrous iron transport protein A [Candidatus Delongbacteria bacterium]|nr:ferrous iron transport protein A [Candidatus Delongbacteria bacterium]